MWKKMLNNKPIKKYFQNIFILYSVLFISMIFLIYQYFFIKGKSFIWLLDGWDQHYKALLYYSAWLKDIFSNIVINHSFAIPSYSFSIGYGSDILSTLHYYVIGDPLNLFSVFFSASSMPYFYSILILIRLYLAGGSFLYYCRYRKKSTDISFLAGAFIYIFCSFTLFAAIRHPYFINPMIYLPLLFTGIEKILNEKKPKLFIISVFVSAISNFYFLYTLVLLTIIYVILRLISIYKKDIKNILKNICIIGVYSGIGILLSAAILLPVILFFFSDTRSKSSYVYDFLYPREYYEKFLSSFITYSTPGFWTRFGYGAISLPAIFILFIKQRKNTTLKIAFISLTTCTLLPLAGHIFNGFSYITNRWIWGYSMLMGYIIITMWKELISVSKKEAVILVSLTIIYAIVSRFFYGTHSNNFNTSLFIIIATLFVILLSEKRFKKYKEVFLLISVLLSIAANAYYAYSPKYENYTSEFVDMDKIDSKLKNTEGTILASIAEKNTDFYRYSGSKITRNVTLINGLSSTQYYWSLSNGVITDFFDTFSLLENTTFNYKALDERAILNALAGVKYYVTLNKDNADLYIPYGYTKITPKNLSGKSNYTVYINNYELPLGYTYSSYLLPKDIEELDPIQRQEAILSSILLEEPINDFENNKVISTSKNIKYKLKCHSENITNKDQSFIVTKKNSGITLSFQGKENAETYLYIKGLEYTPVSELSLYNHDTRIDPLDLYTEEDFKALSQKQQNRLLKKDKYFEGAKKLVFDIKAVTTDKVYTHKELSYKTPKHSWFSNRHNFIVNLGYSKTAKKAVTIRFPEVGIYTYDNIEIVCQPMDDYENKIELRKESVLENINLHKTGRSYATNTVTGNISLQKEKILCLSIPYSKGWSVLVDGKEEKLYKANVMYMALPLTKGEHEIVLKYTTPGIKLGMLLTLLGIIISIGLGRIPRQTHK